jgi:hypothetical protein
VVFNLVEWADHQDRVAELVRVAHEGNPGNAELAALAKELERLDPGLILPGERTRQEKPGKILGYFLGALILAGLALFLGSIWLQVWLDAPREFAMINANSRKCLDVAAASREDNASVLQFACGGAGSQQWRLRADADESYEIINVHSGKCLDVENGSVEDNANVQQYTCHGGNNQRWRIEPSESVGDTPAYLIINEKSKKCLDVFMDSTADNANVQQFACHDGPNQRWYGFAL